MTEDSGDDEFVLGDAEAETESTVTCPHCGEEVEISLDPDGGDSQEYEEECDACGKMWTLRVHYNVDGRAEVEVEPLED